MIKREVPVNWNLIPIGCRMQYDSIKHTLYVDGCAAQYQSDITKLDVLEQVALVQYFGLNFDAILRLCSVYGEREV